MDIYTYTDIHTYIHTHTHTHTHTHIYIYKIHNSKLFAKGKYMAEKKRSNLAMC